MLSEQDSNSNNIGNNEQKSQVNEVNLPQSNQLELVQLFIKEETMQKCFLCLELIENDAYVDHQIKCEENYQQLVETVQFKKCSYCSSQMPDHELADHQSICLYHESSCPHCGEDVFNFLFEGHIKKCQEDLQHLKFVKKQREFQKFQHQNGIQDYFEGVCRWCEQPIPEQLLKDHKVLCQVRLEIEEELEKCKLSASQSQAMGQMYRKSSYEHLKSKQKVLQEMFNMGYDQGDLLLMREYIEHQAPLIIHIKLPNVLYHLNRDTQYRNLFETNRSGGSTSYTNRIKWESYLFGNAYDQCKDAERIKYGVINYANDKHGISKCRGYGTSTMLLKQHVRKRCTIAHHRKYKQNQIVGTLKYSYSVLSLFEPFELQTLYMASQGYEVDSSDLQKFKEIHVHGPIKLAEDVECIYTSRQQRNKLKKEVARFEKQFGVKIIAIEDLLQSQL